MTRTCAPVQVGPLEIHPGEGLVLAATRAVPLSVREFGLLVALATSRGTIVSREELSRRVWGRELRHGDRSVDVYVRKLRVKLEQALPGHRFIHTHVGFGYRLAHELSHVVHTGPADRAHPVGQMAAGARRDP